MILRIAAVITVLALMPAAASEPVPLDNFLAGFADNCKAGADFAALKASIVSKVSFEYTDVFEVEVPADVRPAFAYPAMSDAEPDTGSVVVQIPLKNAQYKGLRVNILGMRLARNYKIIDDFLLFDETSPVVRERLQELLATADESVLGKLYEFDVLDGFVGEDGPPAFRCMIMAHY
jgi:hypothetical protein